MIIVSIFLFPDFFLVVLYMFVYFFFLSDLCFFLFFFFFSSRRRHTRLTCDWSSDVCSSDLPELRLISNGRNRGKGFSVRRGMLEARGEIALFTDADLSAPIEEAEKLLAPLRDGSCDGAIGSRAMDRSLIEVHQPAYRERAGMVFNRIMRGMIGLPFQDTQCGFKAFRREKAHIIFEQQRTEGFGFDPEILFLARQKGLRIVEIPVRWAHDPTTKVSLLRDSVRMFLDLIAIRWNALVGRYPMRSV